MSGDEDELARLKIRATRRQVDSAPTLKKCSTSLNSGSNVLGALVEIRQG